MLRNRVQDMIQGFYSLTAKLRSANESYHANREKIQIAYPMLDCVSRRQGVVHGTPVKEAVAVLRPWQWPMPSLMRQISSRFWQSCVQYYKASHPSVTRHHIVFHPSAVKSTRRAAHQSRKARTIQRPLPTIFEYVSQDHDEDMAVLAPPVARFGPSHDTEIRAIHCNRCDMWLNGPTQ